MYVRVGVLAIVMVFLGAGCGAVERVLPRPTPSLAHLDARPASDPAAGPPVLAWASEIPRAIMIDRESRALVLYEHGEPVQVFDAVFGRVPGRKRHEGDKKTPSGVYRVTRKRHHWKFHKFLDIDYPNEEDMRRYREAAERGRLPKMPSGRPAGPGRLVGIHGSNDERLNRLDIDWTLGCVSLLNEDVDRLYASVEEGTLVVIDEPPPVATRAVAVEVPSPEAADPEAAPSEPAAQQARADGLRGADMSRIESPSPTALR